MSKLIQLGGHLNRSTCKYYTLVDNDDFVCLSKYKWSLLSQSNQYATRGIFLRRGNKKIYKRIYMHREILKVSNKYEVDHINSNKLDNRKKNLRKCTKAENKMNRPIHSNNTVGFKGVRRSGKKWISQIGYKGKMHHLGTFSDKIEAAKAYDIAALKFHGKFARGNNLI